MRDFLATPFWVLATINLWIVSFIMGQGVAVVMYEDDDEEDEDE